jgi:hypothetical protein
MAAWSELQVATPNPLRNAPTTAPSVVAHHYQIFTSICQGGLRASASMARLGMFPDLEAAAAGAFFTRQAELVAGKPKTNPPPFVSQR